MAKIAITGMAATDKALRQLGVKTANKLIRGALKQAAKEMAIEVNQQVPVETGLLQSEIKVKPIKRSRNKMGSRVLISDVKHNDGSTSIVGFVEFGTKDTKANPFFRRSLDNKGPAVKNTAMDEVEAAITQAINEVAKG